MECVGCGCTDDHPCETEFGEGCFWVQPNLCSECANAPDEDEPVDLDAFPRYPASVPPYRQPLIPRRVG
jgi:hypothetical protein